MNRNDKAPGKSFRKGIALLEVFDLFPDEDSARNWIESIVWPDGMAVCFRCNGTNTYEVKNRKPLPHRCRDCRKHFSVRHGTIFAESHIPLQKWAIAIYLLATNLKGVSSMKLHRDLGITQKSAWFMLHRIRETFQFKDSMFFGTVEVDETYMGGKEFNKQEIASKSAGSNCKDRSSWNQAPTYESSQSQIY